MYHSLSTRTRDVKQVDKRSETCSSGERHLGVETSSPIVANFLNIVLPHGVVTEKKRKVKAALSHQSTALTAPIKELIKVRVTAIFNAEA
jgi:hypothetical protein